MASFITKNLLSSFKTLIFVLFRKKFFIELIWVSPIPSIFRRSSILLNFDNDKKFFIDFKFFAINFAFSRPICPYP
jgi:hypothetical protein